MDNKITKKIIKKIIKKMEVTITYKWWKSERDNGCIVEKHKDHLDECAHKNIRHMIKNGFTGSEMICNIDDVYYSGNWQITKHEGL